MKLPTKPIANSLPSTADQTDISDFAKSSTVAPSIVGIANKNENSTASFRFIPTAMPPKIVAKALDIPGIIDSI